MADDKTNWRHVDRDLYFPPNPDDPVVKLLGLYGIPYERIYAAAAGAVYFTGKKIRGVLDQYFWGI